MNVKNGGFVYVFNSKTFMKDVLKRNDDAKTYTILEPVRIPDK